MRVGPITRTINGPMATTAGGYAYRTSYDFRSWYRSGGDRRTPNPFDSQGSEAVQVGYWFGGAVEQTSVEPLYSMSQFPSWMVDRATQSAYGNFVSAVQQKAELGAAAAQFSQSADMVTLRAGQLIAGLRGLRKGRWNFPFRRPKNLKDLSKDLSDLWLEYSYGWAPLIQDIGTAVDVLQGTPPSARVTGTGRQQFDSTFTSGGYRVRISGNTMVQFRGRIKVLNPNLNLANQMGLINPLAVAWELVPWSFVVDWFVPVGQFLNSFSDLAGLELTETSKSQLLRGNSRYEWPGDPLDTYSGKGYVFRRTLDKPSFNLVFKELKAPSIKRAANAISLLVQQMR